jgi:hypothetical protein
VSGPRHRQKPGNSRQCGRCGASTCCHLLHVNKSRNFRSRRLGILREILVLPCAHDAWQHHEECCETSVMQSDLVSADTASGHPVCFPCSHTMPLPEHLHTLCDLRDLSSANIVGYVLGHNQPSTSSRGHPCSRSLENLGLLEAPCFRGA